MVINRQELCVVIRHRRFYVDSLPEGTAVGRTLVNIEFIDGSFYTVDL